MTTTDLHAHAPASVVSGDDLADYARKLYQSYALTLTQDPESFTLADQLNHLVQVANDLGYSDVEYDTLPGILRNFNYISRDFWVEYVSQLIDECYPWTDGSSSEWPYYHLTMDYESAAEELRSNYAEVMLGSFFYLAEMI